MRPADAWIDPTQPRAARDDYPRPFRPRARRSRRRARDQGDAGDHGMPVRPAEGRSRSPMVRPFASATLRSALSPPATSSDLRRSCSTIGPRRWWCPVTINADLIRPAPASCRCRAMSSSPRPRSASRVPPSRDWQRNRPAARPPAFRILAAACWLAPMRWRKRSGSSAELRSRGHHDPIYFHGAIERLNQLYESFGIELGELRHTATPPPSRKWRVMS